MFTYLFTYLPLKFSSNNIKCAKFVSTYFINSVGQPTGLNDRTHLVSRIEIAVLGGTDNGKSIDDKNSSELYFIGLPIINPRVGNFFRVVKACDTTYRRTSAELLPS